MNSTNKGYNIFYETKPVKPEQNTTSFTGYRSLKLSDLSTKEITNRITNLETRLSKSKPNRLSPELKNELKALLINLETRQIKT